GPGWGEDRRQGDREALALLCLALAGYETYGPGLRDRRIRHGRRVELRPALFPGYAFIAIELQGHTARWTAGVINLIMDGSGPARVPDSVIDEIRSRERGGLVELPKPAGPSPGDRVRVLAGP